MKTFFFLETTRKIVSLVLGLENSCSWPREGLSSESRSLAMASDFFVSLALASSLVSSIQSFSQFYGLDVCDLNAGHI